MNVSEERLKEWIEKADHDLGTAVVIHNHIPDYSDTLSFHCQQSAEKYIKCLLEKYSIKFKKSHDLRYLLDLLNGMLTITSEMYDKAMKLNAFGVEVRYPDVKIVMTIEERKEAIEIARFFRDFLKKNIGFEID
jgi:HEPN domain-containing protein